MGKMISRRQFLKLVAAGAITAKFRSKSRTYANPLVVKGNLYLDTPTYMGRAIYNVTFYVQPSVNSSRVTTRARDEAFPIWGEVHAPFDSHNDLWYRTSLGFVHSAWVLPIRVYPEQPFIADIGDWGFWGEVSQVYTEAYAEPSVTAAKKYRFYAGTVYHVIEAFQDEQGVGWYKVFDDYPPKTVGNYQWVQAKDVRNVPRHEMSPIHPFVGNKRIEVDLSRQLLTCYEGDIEVFSTLVASGLGGTPTPRGEKRVLLKQPSRHMSNVPYSDGPEPEGSIFDLPGVPWNTFFDMDGSAIHGAYWHNDFGLPRSHGCLNVPCEAARWIYRWVHPIGGFADDFVRSDFGSVGTPINIF
ncbi:MAG: L,D-transpeptidase [Anaerolineae bacterium]|nr:L,D-transpeptidase [Anaerolineae bacterium]